jgi:hypothetical protein
LRLTEADLHKAIDFFKQATDFDPGCALAWSPFIQRFKDDPRFAAFCRKVGLPAVSAIKS